MNNTNGRRFKLKARQKIRKESRDRKLGRDASAIPRSSKQETLQKGQILSNVYQKSFGSPTTSSLNNRRGHSGLCQGCSTTRTHGLSCHFTGEELTKAQNEKGTSGHRSITGDPQSVCKGVKCVARVQVLNKDPEWIETKTLPWNNDTVSFEKLVSFMSW